jgi:P-type E1-E2 ATPase
VICIEDPLRPEAGRVIASLRSRGIDRVVMLTGDSCVCAATVARTLGIDEYHAQVLPEDKASYVEELRAQGRHVIMVGDGINDSPALAKADVSVALNDASDIARAVADVTVLNSSTVAVTALNATPLLRGRAAHDQEDQEEEPVYETA